MQPIGTAEIGIVVKSIAESGRRLAALFGGEPPEAVRPEVRRAVLYGEEQEGRMRLAFFPVGSVVLKLIEPDGRPGIFQNFLEENGEGIHHIAWRVADLEGEARALVAAGAPVMQVQEFQGGRGMFFDAGAQIKTAIELVCETPGEGK